MKKFALLFSTHCLPISFAILSVVLVSFALVWLFAHTHTLTQRFVAAVAAKYKSISCIGIATAIAHREHFFMCVVKVYVRANECSLAKWAWSH